MLEGRKIISQTFFPDPGWASPPFLGERSHLVFRLPRRRRRREITKDESQVRNPLLPWALGPSLIATSRPTVCLKQMRLRPQFLTTSLTKEVTMDRIQHKGGTILGIFWQWTSAGKVTGKGNWVPNSHRISVCWRTN